jgi:hypothetical protein
MTAPHTRTPSGATSADARLAQAEVTQKSRRLGAGAGPFGGAGVLALVGKKNVARAAPPVPTQAIAGVQADIAAATKGMSR